MGLRWSDTIDIAIELYEAHPDVVRSGFVLQTYMRGCVPYQTLVMIRPSRLKVCLKQFKWHGLTKHDNPCIEKSNFLQSKSRKLCIMSV